MPVTAPYGSWKSPITAELIAGQTVAFGGLAVDGADLYWSESRPREGGRQTVMRLRNGAIEECLPEPFSARSRAHEYGGGAFTVAGGVLYFSNHADNRIYRKRDGEVPQPISPHAPRRYADLVFDPLRQRLLAVCEQHAGDREPVNTLVAIGVADEAEPLTLAAGHDFYASPAPSPDGRRLAWLAWNHPNMPWDGSELWMAGLDSNGHPLNAQPIAGGSGESIFQPQFAPDGALYFVSDRSGWWNLYRWHEQRIEPVWPRAAEFGLPQWQFGMSTYSFTGEHELVAAFNERGRWKLARLDTRRLEASEIDVPDSDISGLRALAGQAAYVGASPLESPAIVRLDPSSGWREVLRRSTESVVDPGFLSAPTTLEFPTEGGEAANTPNQLTGRTSGASRASTTSRGPRTRFPGVHPITPPIGESAHGFFYLPHNRDYTPPPGEKPPLLVLSHGGPTAATSSALNFRIQYWTSRGFAVLDVNYRGSTGFGRTYREKLNERWGIADVEDCVHGARFLVRQGLVDERRLAIRGGSAGGYTTLCALVFHDVFRAAAVYYGVSDLEALTHETHKFEAHYLDRLVGPYPATCRSTSAAEAGTEALLAPLARPVNYFDRERPMRERYRERSPIHHAERLTCPVIFFQGLDDKVVPPGQTERMVDVLRRKRLPVAYVPFEGEAHGFRRADSIRRALEAEYYFYCRVFGFEPGERLSPVAITNLD